MSLNGTVRLVPRLLPLCLAIAGCWSPMVAPRIEQFPAEIASSREKDAKIRGLYGLGASGRVAGAIAVRYEHIHMSASEKQKIIHRLAELLGDERWVWVVDNLTTPGREAASTLAVVGEPAIPFLIEALREGSKAARVNAAIGLEEAAAPTATAALIDALKDRDKEVRHYAASAFGRIKDPRSVEPLIEAVQAGNRAAVWALGNQGDPRAVDVLRRNASYDAVRALSVISDPRAHEAILEILNSSSDTMTQREAAHILAKRGERRAVPSLMKLAAESDGATKEVAIEALGLIGDESATDLLVGMLREDSWRVRREAARALGQIADARAAEALLESLKDADKLVRAEAAAALGQIGDPLALDALLAAVERDNDNVRASGATALGQLRIRDPRIIKALISLLGSRDRDVQRNSRAALKKLTGQDFGVRVEEWHDWLRTNELPPDVGQ